MGDSEKTDGPSLRGKSLLSQKSGLLFPTGIGRSASAVPMIDMNMIKVNSAAEHAASTHHIVDPSRDALGPPEKQEQVLQDLERKIRDPQSGFTIGDRRSGMKVFPQCFVGHEAVNWLMEHLSISRPEAVAVGNKLMKRGVFEHVTREHDFKDDNLYYRFPKLRPKSAQDSLTGASADRIRAALESKLSEPAPTGPVLDPHQRKLVEMAKSGLGGYYSSIIPKANASQPATPAVDKPPVPPGQPNPPSHEDSPTSTSNSTFTAIGNVFQDMGTTISRNFQSVFESSPTYSRPNSIALPSSTISQAGVISPTYPEPIRKMSSGSVGLPYGSGPPMSGSVSNATGTLLTVPTSTTQSFPQRTHTDETYGSSVTFGPTTFNHAPSDASMQSVGSDAGSVSSSMFVTAPSPLARIPAVSITRSTSEPTQSSKKSTNSANSKSSDLTYVAPDAGDFMQQFHGADTSVKMEEFEKRPELQKFAQQMISFSRKSSRSRRAEGEGSVSPANSQQSEAFPYSPTPESTTHLPERYSRIVGIVQENNALLEMTNTKRQATEETLQKLEDLVQTGEDAFSKIQRECEKLQKLIESKVSIVESKMDALNRRLDTVERANDQILVQLQRVKEQANDAEAVVGRTSEQLSALRYDMGNISASGKVDAIYGILAYVLNGAGALARSFASVFRMFRPKPAAPKATTRSLSTFSRASPLTSARMAESFTNRSASTTASSVDASGRREDASPDWPGASPKGQSPTDSSFSFPSVGSGDNFSFMNHAQAEPDEMFRAQFMKKKS